MEFELEYRNLIHSLTIQTHKIPCNVNEENYKIVVSYRHYSILDYYTVNPQRGHQIYGIEILMGNIRKPKLIII